jgi:hypothetical protein
MSNFLMFVLGAAGTDAILAMTADESLLVLDAGHSDLMQKYTPPKAHKIELETYEVIRGIARLARVQAPHAVWRTDP